MCNKRNVYVYITEGIRPEILLSLSLFPEIPFSCGLQEEEEEEEEVRFSLFPKIPFFCGGEVFIISHRLHPHNPHSSCFQTAAKGGDCE